MILLSFDTEEFDLPREHGVQISLDDSMKVSSSGVTTILNILRSENVHATFFCTTTFAENAPELMSRIIAEGHEVASHGCDHTNPKPTDIELSKKRLQKLYPSTKINGYRQPRMFSVNNLSLKTSGYLYNSSLHPAFIPGRYMHFDKPRVPFIEDGIVQIPASVTPWIRLPIFWLACHNYPFWLYCQLCIHGNLLTLEVTLVGEYLQ
jgi:peptidoglycan/xylan/chitin deacetylase (PgdA/CDA1 family)